MEKLKNALDIARQLIIIILFLILIFFPAKINSVLTRAGFTKGSVLGFDWEKQIEASRDTVQLAKNQVEEIKGQLSALATQISGLENRVQTDSSRHDLRRLSDSLHTSIYKINQTNSILSRNLAAHGRLMQSVQQATE